MIDTLIIDNLFVAEVQIKEVVLHVAAPEPRVAGSFSGLKT